DVQDSYKYFAGDAFVDLPIGPVGVLTGQINVAHWDGGGYVALAKQTAFMGEAGFNFLAAHVSPIVRVEHITGSGTAAMPPFQPTQTRIAGGVAFWPFGHNTNLKAF